MLLNNGPDNTVEPPTQNHSGFSPSPSLPNPTRLLVQQAPGFFTAVFKQQVGSDAALEHPGYELAAAAEKLIVNNLMRPFAGVENIARAVAVSPTKLKSIFKAVFGFSMLQYYKEKNILLAMQLLSQPGLPVKNIAALTGYQSAGKFAAAFKKRFGISPAATRKK